jgi:hypothetical protein
VGHGQFAVGAGVGDGPQLAVADRLPDVSQQAPVVAAGGDHVTRVGVLGAADRNAQVGVEVTGVEARVLDRPVDGSTCSFAAVVIATVSRSEWWMIHSVAIAALCSVRVPAITRPCSK